jgi:hypothetical protein
VPVGVADIYASQMRSLVGGTFDARVFILLHELADYFKVSGFTQGDASTGAQKQENDLIWKNCSKTIGGRLGA